MDLATANLSMYPGAPQSMAQDAAGDTSAKIAADKAAADKASADKSKQGKTGPTTPVPPPPAAAPTAGTQYGQGVDQNALGANRQYGQPAQ